jgi:hypothetical protein
MNRLFKEVDMTEINTKSELIRALKDSSQRAERWFREIPAIDFFTRLGEVWSPSDNVDHLIKAVKPITLALKLPKITLQAMFGKPEKPSMTYEELCRRYREEIAKGAKASGRYLPKQETPGENAEEKKNEYLAQWSAVSAEFASVVEKWDEYELNQYQLPHPLIGKLTVREMIYFTIYHNLRHASLEGD